MLINSLNIQYNDELIITDVDDCLMLTSKSIRSHGLKIRSFYLNKLVYDKHKQRVYEEAELTEWGREFVHMVSNGIIKRYKLLTSAHDRIDILCNKFNVTQSNVIESMMYYDKVEYLNEIKENAIYVDDKTRVINLVNNDSMTLINYPKMISKIVTRGKIKRLRS